MIDRAAILHRLEGEQDDALLRRIKPWLGREDTRIVSNRVSKVTVSEARRLWSTRLKNTDITGQQLEGAASFLARLETLTPQRKLEQVAFTGPQTSGNLFFEGSTHHYVGAILFETRDQQKRA